MDGKSIVEAALYSSEQGLCIADIATRTNLSPEEIRLALMDLQREYEMRGSSIMISKMGQNFRMMLRPEYSQYAEIFGRPEMTPGMQKTLSTIAYNQPVIQSELFKTRGSRIYDDVKALIDMGFVSSRPAGQSAELTTTKKFSEYFGIGSTKKEDIRAWIEAMARNR